MAINQRNQPLYAADATLDENTACGRSAVAVVIAYSGSTSFVNLFSKALLRDSEFLSLKSWHGPWAGFIWYQIYFTSQSMVVQPIWEAGAALCLSSYARLLLFLVHFPGNSHDENSGSREFVNVSDMLRGIWEWSAITPRHWEEKHVSEVAVGWKGVRKKAPGGHSFFQMAQFFILCDSIEGEQGHFFCLNFPHFFLFAVFVLFIQYANGQVIYGRL